MMNGPIFAMVWEGANAAILVRKMVGAKTPFDSQPGTIRCDLALGAGRKVLGASDTAEAAKREAAIWFSGKEINNWEKGDYNWVYEKWFSIELIIKKS